jgi:ribose transport system permease protein
VDRHLIKVYALSGLLAGLAGVLSLAQFGTTAIAGQTQTNLNVIAAVVIGGTSLFGGVGTIFGTVVGLFIPAVLQNGFVIVGVQPFWQQVAVGAVLIAAVFIDQRRRAAAARGGKRSSLRFRSAGKGSSDARGGES